MVDQEQQQQPATSTKAKKGAKAKKGTANKKAAPAKKGAGASGTPPVAQQRKATGERPPAKLTFKQKEATDYVRMATAHNVWYYRDRMNVARGPCTLPVLKECWVHGIIAEDTLVWGHGLIDFLPIRNVRTLVPQIRTPEVQVATWFKRTFALKPALNKIRKERAEHRHDQSDQVDTMY
ncbi:hypothetical protein ABBQ38_011825 [Trebouxia sp. C0009 RCD-2024]